jgi:hypothetical protein
MRSLREQKAIRRALSRAANDEERLHKLREREARFEAYHRQRDEARAARQAIEKQQRRAAASTGARQE